ncbi:DUF3703 domain-containing protein [Pseudoalteromonas ardens]|uniref:DUF3703 domain-containing protein n=1 Tax=Pseudoalteromonas rubra TaxID=43658 RepID=A0A0L0ETE5_9GAMM|nr:DUF3703 domain-containing protein [Pseudoalteromonas sp. R96]KNC67762.1 hypothetical protein AC626_08730 [Pseudoalteromonas rubra]MDK1312851.1 DUF3703 domain-containing protein [Pseudoalteromonas sp. R96]
MNHKLTLAFQQEMAAAKELYDNAQYSKSFYHLERAHILGQSFIIPHTQSHWWMLKLGFKRYSVREVLGQIARIFASVIFSRIWVPKGNTGGTNVSPIKPMPIPADLAEYLK